MAMHVDVSDSSSALLAALSRQTATMTTATTASPASSAASPSSSACLLDIVDVIVVDSSDEEDRPVVVPLQVVLKQAEADGIHVKYELRAVESDVMDLCFDGESESEDQVATDKDSNVPVMMNNGPVYEHVGRFGSKELSLGASTTTLRFKRRKVVQESTSSTDNILLSIVDANEESSEDSTASLSESSDLDDGYEDDADADYEDTDDESDSDEDESSRTKQIRGFRRLQLRSSGLMRDQVDEIIRRDVRRLEKKKPWQFVYRCLDVPFKTNRAIDVYDLLFERWDAFWKNYGRAVWERYFWAPLEPGTLEYNRRKHRQWRAMRTFRVLATDLYEKLGPPFLERLVSQVHDGWWYRTDPFMLRELFYLDKRKYEMYLKVHRQRFPRGSHFEKSLDAAWCLDDESLATGGGCDGASGACLAWQDVVKSDDEDGSDCG